jgi:hypothetical protein
MREQGDAVRQAQGDTLMCTVSMVIDQWQQPSSPNFIPQTQWMSDPALAAQMLEVLKRLEEIDKKLGLLEQCRFTQAQKRGLKKKLRRAARGA